MMDSGTLYQDAEDLFRLHRGFRAWLFNGVETLPVAPMGPQHRELARWPLNLLGARQRIQLRP
jgi:hypothetical protein